MASFGASGGVSGSSSNDIFSQLVNSISQLSTAQAGSSSVTPTQDPMFTAFRESILPAISQQYAAAQQPLYGNAQIAQVANQGNQATQGAETALANNAARRGVLNSGATQAGNTALQQANTANVTGFESQIPFLNEQVQQQRTNSLLGLATSFLGQAPIGQATTFGQTGQQTGTQQQATTGQYNQTQTGYQAGGGVTAGF